MKLSAIYGANAAGKSNLVKALHCLQKIVIEGKLLDNQENTRFKLRDTLGKPQRFEIEFFQGGKAYYYALCVVGKRIASEELYLSGLGVKDDELVFERVTGEDNQTTLRFPESLISQETAELKLLVEKYLAKPEKPLLELLSGLEGTLFEPAVEAFAWFKRTLYVVLSSGNPSILAYVQMDRDSDLLKYVQDVVRSLHMGIDEVTIDEMTLRPEDSGYKMLKEGLTASPDKAVGKGSCYITEKGDGVLFRTLRLNHSSKRGEQVPFLMAEESDGTLRLLELLPVFRDICSEERVYVIDEIERGVHPNLIKELVSKFATDGNTKGQLIFTTHGVPLLDESVFRKDEIWFANKGVDNSTDLYSLSAFKKHDTKDIGKNYLSGRYEAVPLTGNLQDLDWHTHGTKE
ncbi:MAG: ATP-binding protein [Tannerellaceae bacterium]|nr:ATP-binding protein [Tannerellaceae bacterium]